ncbi:formyltetrahydrofolate deformylase [Rhodopseudomonas palustris]|uniref:formyltetrahydrofolate deformylase n=1 Tax=Rhodopseudomonas palustris TaxID=1076 RepID=UPI002ACDE915|nr:formyltetrahydrofolate deformylase [Rhodopseudomonas palustris]WQG99420.1 formyltetrahydrofolate deformylase [Rhodopseudomonas palustris]
MPHTNVVLSLSCRDQPGIVAAVAKALFDAGCNVVEAHQFNDAETHLFFMRMRFAMLKPDASIAALEAAFEPVADEFGINWTMRSLSEKQRVMILVSKFDHCLADLLYRWRSGEIAMDIAGIIANHPRETYAHLDLDGIPFHYLPVTKPTKMEQEAQVWELIRAANTDLVVLARYMQVLSDGLCAKLAGRCINIHHSFLPGFKGARPYHQAFERGVKLIGATAHYVTPDLDEGPIIEQDVERISHHNCVEDLVRKGREIERRVLARAITWHIDGRVIVNGTKTVVFKD